MAAAAPAADPVKRPGVWAQTYAGRPADPAVRFGQLSNGMRFAILHNATPKAQASLYLRIGSGSIAERDDQQGLAHFLEHMAFRGSTHVPEGDMIRILERKGLQLGPDTNAETGQEHTLYKFNLPESDAETLDTGMMLLREIAGELTLAQPAMDAERGVVLSEERLRDSPGYRGYVAQIGFELAGQRAAARMPIGKVDILQHAPVARIRDYYDAWYRPDNATLIAIGDFDVDAMEARIRARFTDWRPKEAAPAAPDLGQIAARKPDTALFVQPGAPLRLAATWAEPYDPTADTAARERRDLIEQLALQVLNRRLERLAEGAAPPFVAAQGRRSNTLRSAKLTQLFVQPQPGAWQSALDTAIGAERLLARYGPRQDEVDREITELRTSFATAAAGAATRTTPALAGALSQSVDEEDVFTSPAQDLAEFERAVTGLKAAEVGTAAQRIFTGTGPLVFLSSPETVAGGKAAVATALASAETRPLAQAAASTARTWPYASFGTPGRVVERHEIADLGLTEARFANGVRLLVKPTAFAKDEIVVGARFGYGRLGLPAGVAVPGLWTIDSPIFALGGTRELTFDEIQELTASRIANAQLALLDDSYLLGGQTRPQDLDVQLQLLTAYLTRPGYRAQAFDRLKGAMTAQLPQLDATASGVFAREAGPVLHGGDPRWELVPSAAELAASKPGDLPALLDDALAKGPLEITLVGDTTADAAIAAVARTFGALPVRPARTPPGDRVRGIAFPSPVAQPVVKLHHGRADQAVILAAWPTTDYFADPQEQRVLGVTGEVLRSRLFDRLRVTEGATYSPSADSDSSLIFERYGYLQAHIETPVTKVDGVYAAIDAIVADMRAHPATADELARAKAPRVEQRIKVQQTNGYWSGALNAAFDDPRWLDAIRQLVTGTRQVTADDVAAASKRYLVPQTEFRMTVRAAPAPVTPTAP